jgi:hypothetical protein
MTRLWGKVEMGQLLLPLLLLLLMQWKAHAAACHLMYCVLCCRIWEQPASWDVTAPPAMHGELNSADVAICPVPIIGSGITCRGCSNGASMLAPCFTATKQISM